MLILVYLFLLPAFSNKAVTVLGACPGYEHPKVIGDSSVANMSTTDNASDIENFLSGTVNRESLNKLKKNDLSAIATHLELSLPPNPTKAQLTSAIMSVYGESGEDTSKLNQMDLMKLELEKEKLKLQQQQLASEQAESQLQQIREQAQFQHQQAELQFQREEFARKALKEREEAQRRHEEAQRQHEVRMQELKLEELKLKGKHDKDSESAIDVTRHIRLVPKFNEQEVSKYFLMFEKVAASMKWDKSVWPVLLQSVISGKAQEIFSALTPDQSADYDFVKGAILKAYELVPEAYRQKFRHLQKQHSQTYVEFSREKENLFNRWCESKEIKDLESLRQLILMEEFKRCIPKEIKLHLEEIKVDEIEKASVVADDYALTHKVVFSKSSYSKKGSLESRGSSSQDVSGKPEGEKSSENKGKSSTSSNFHRDVTCSYCKKKGHIVSECFKLKNREAKFVGLTNSRVPDTNFQFPFANVDISFTTDPVVKLPRSIPENLEGFE